MLVVHGGGWFIGEKEQLEGYARGLSDMGYVCVSCLQQLRPAAWESGGVSLGHSIAALVPSFESF